MRRTHLARAILTALTAPILLAGVAAFCAPSFGADSSGVAVSQNRDFPAVDVDYQATFIYAAEPGTEAVSLNCNLWYYTREDAENYKAGGTGAVTAKKIFDYEPGMLQAGYVAVGTAAGRYELRRSPGTEDVWQITLPLHSGVYAYDYDVTADGVTTQRPDPANPPPASPVSGRDCGWSLLRVGDGSDALPGQEYTLPRTDRQRGTVLHETYAAVDGTRQPLTVYLPWGYDGTQEYPVLYLSHGGGGTEVDWFTLGAADAVFDNLIAAGLVEPTVVVAMDNSYFDWDYDSIRANLMGNIIPVMEKRYSVSSNPALRAYAGLSTGSLTATAVYAALAEEFGYIGMFSSTNGGNLDLSRVPGATYPVLMLGYGVMDFGRGGYPAFIEKLDAAGVRYTLCEVPGAYDWGTWRALLTVFARDCLWEDHQLTGTVTVTGDPPGPGDTVNAMPGGAAAALPVEALHFQWQNSRDGKTWRDIADAEASDYTLIPAVAKGTPYLRATVRADGHLGTLCSMPMALRGTACTISFDPGGGAGESAAVDYAAGETFTFPVCPFDPPAGRVFDGWQTDRDDAVYAPGRTVTVCGDMTVTARWRELAEVPFADVVPGMYCHNPVLWAVNRYPVVTNGTDAARFSPDAVCTRGQVVTFLWRTAGEPEPGTTVCPFTDVDAGDYCRDAVLWAAERGVTNGTGPTTFSPESGCTRAQAVTFLWRARGRPYPGGEDCPFTDVEKSWYRDAVLWAAENGVTDGVSATAFGPDAVCTRGQIVTFLYRDTERPPE